VKFRQLGSLSRKSGGKALGIYVLDPTNLQATVTGFNTAPRLKTLDGKRIGVINNGKRRADFILQSIIELLQKEYLIAGIKWVKKPSVSHPISPELISKLQDCHLVLSGVGD
jgi:hypothetical protein